MRRTRREKRPRERRGAPFDAVRVADGQRQRRPFGSSILAGSVEVPVQYFQSVIAIELAVAGALLWQMRFFESRGTKRRDSEQLPDSRLRLGLALVLGATMFGSLWAMADEGPKWAAVAVTIGLAVSLIPILLRVLPPLARDSRTNERDPAYAVTIAGLLAYIAIVAGFLVVLDIE
jgi:peptidoglycan/LPS O-acetylase OafA/YrhL